MPIGPQRIAPGYDSRIAAIVLVQQQSRLTSLSLVSVAFMLTAEADRALLTPCES